MELHSYRNKQRPLVILAPRGGAKSTFLFGETLRQIVLGIQKFIIRVEINEKYANKEVFKIRSEIETNLQILADFGQLKGSPWTASELYFTNGCMLWGRGRRQPVRGTTYKEWRPTWIIYNDIEDPKQVSNPKLTQEIYKALTLEALPALNPVSSGGGHLAVVGTLLGKESMLATLMGDRVAKKVYYEALYPKDPGDEGIISVLLDKVSQDVDSIMDYVDLYKGDSLEALIARRAYFSGHSEYQRLISKIESYWPDRYPVEELLLIAATTGTPAFKQEYLHIPVDSTASGPFDREWFFRPQNIYSIHDIPGKNLIRATFLDPSYRDTASSDHKGFVTGFYSLDTMTGYVINVDGGNISYEAMVQKSFDIAEEFLIGKVVLHENGETRVFEEDAFVDSIFGYEDNGAQIWLEPVFKKDAAVHGFELPKLTGVTHISDKIARISKTSYYIERGRIKMNPHDAAQLECIDELCSILDKQRKKDKADAFEGWWALIARGYSSVSFGKYDKPLSKSPLSNGLAGFRQSWYSPENRDRYVSYSKRRS